LILIHKKNNKQYFYLHAGLPVHILMNKFDRINPVTDFNKVIERASFIARNGRSNNNQEAVLKALFYDPINNGLKSS